MTYAHGDGLTEAGYEINLYTYNEDHKVSSVTDLSSIARHSNNLVCRAKKIGPKSYAIYFDDTYDSSGTVIYCRLDSTDNRWHWQY
ncbi:hypothetical protein [Streptomyces tunisiensis]|uniref:hypothetical protein n=1 Tax=Streptomyces tunisiensis TaxID=948699 RepID=UPI00403DC582